MRSLILVIFLISSFSSFAQMNLVWAKQMGSTADDIGMSSIVDAFGNVYTTGCFEGVCDFDPGTGSYNLVSAGARDIFISKLDASGNFTWAKRIGGVTGEIGTALSSDLSGNIYVTGWGYAVGTSITKLDAFGSFIWTKNIGVICVRGLTVDVLGNVYTTGCFFNDTEDFDPGPGTYNLTAVGNDDIWISKLDAAGNFVWAKNIGGTGHPEANSIKTDASGNVYLTGYFNGTTDFDPNAGTFSLTASPADYNYDVFILKLDASGNFIWVRNMGGASYDVGEAITLDSSGNIYATGSFEGTADFDPGPGTYNLTSNTVNHYDIYVQKLDASGNFVWAKGIGGSQTD